MRIGILRHQLFKPSEPFISDQAASLKSNKHVFLGREISGVQPLNAQVQLFAEDFVEGLSYILAGNVRDLVKKGKSLGIDLMHAHFGVEGLCSLKAARAMDIPAVTTLHGFDVNYSRRALAASMSPSWLRYSLGRARFMESADRLVCVSEFVRSKALRLGADPDRTCVIPTGVDTSLLVPQPPRAEPVIVQVGRLVEVKGSEYLIRAAAALIRDVPELRLRLVGDGPLRSSLEELAANLGVEAHIQFLGQLSHEETLDVIKSARVLCLPSVATSEGATEGLGQVVLEAAALGRPVVASKSGGIPEAVEDGVSGRLVRERDVSEIAEALKEILNDDQLAQRLGLAGRRIVEERFDLSRCTERLEALYRACA